MAEDDVLGQAADWMGDGKDVALATVIGTWGSSPRPVGSQIAVDTDGAFVGSVSGGCIEGAVIGEALNSINDGQVRVLNFGVTNEQAWEVGLACGGDIKIFVEKATDKATVSRLASERPLATVTDIQTGERNFVTSDDVEGPLALTDEMLGNVRQAIRDDRSKLFDQDSQSLFVQVFNKPLRMLIIGAVHISQALVPMAATAGFDVTVIDPRGSFATDARFPGVTLSEEWPDDALKELAPDARTAVVTLTHDPKLDDPALEIALKSDAFYIGSLGSRRTHASRLERLGELGFGEDDFSRINGPIGLNLGATSPAEIAVSILAQIVAAKHGKLNDL
jgi:xanthine dehydrogenase accessory factor